MLESARERAWSALCANDGRRRTTGAVPLMSKSERTSTIPRTPPDGATVVPFPGTAGGSNGAPGKPPRRRVRVRKLRVLALLVGLGALAVVSTVFGMMMAVASDLPQLEEPAQHNSVVLDHLGHEIGLLTGNQRQIFLPPEEISPVMKHAIIAIEDRRFYTNAGVDLRGIARAFVQDVMHKRAVQGASTITQQFVKNALAAQNHRTVFEKLREAALAYHITRRWSKDRIMGDYLNTIYFGAGAYGIESAARTYFGSNHPGCGDRGAPPCASELLPQEAALLAGIVQSPSAYDPIAHPLAARRRRDLVLLRMMQQGFLTRPQYTAAKSESPPTRRDIQPPQEDTKYPYFTSWVKQQVVDELGGGQAGARLAFSGGLRIKTTIDPRLQDAAQQAVNAWLPYRGGPRASLVAIHNPDGEVRAMVGGDDYAASPFNLATQGQRQPGSAFKAFVLATALERGISPDSVWASHKLVYRLKGGERFTVENFENAYAGLSTLTRATTYSDNTVFVQVADKVGPRRIARVAHEMGIRTSISHNLAMAIGGLKHGVTPLDMAHAYETLAEGGRLTYGTLSPGADHKSRLRPPGPVGIEEIGRPKGNDIKPVTLPGGGDAVNRVRTRRVLPASVAHTEASMLQTVIQSGTATSAQIPGVVIAGKTGTTENYGDAWFVGWTKEYTVAVWVGYPDRFQPMRTEYRGGPVEGGTFPAQIWRTFMESLLKIDPLPKPKTPVIPTTPAPPSTGTTPAPGTTVAPAPTAAPTTAPTPTPPPAATPAPAPTTAPPAGGTGTGTGGTGTGGTGAPPG
jgi:penicillin-binding protein 1A